MHIEKERVAACRQTAAFVGCDHLVAALCRVAATSHFLPPISSRLGVCVVLSCKAIPRCICWWTERVDRPKDKVVRVRRLRQETTMTVNLIAERLRMGAAGSLANLLRDTERKR